MKTGSGSSPPNRSALRAWKIFLGAPDSWVPGRGLINKLIKIVDMIRIQDFFQPTGPVNQLTPSELEKIQDPGQAEHLIRNYLMEPGDRLEIKSEETPIGTRILYEIQQPDGRWHRLHYMKRKRKGEPTPEELQWMQQERERLG